MIQLINYSGEADYITNSDITVSDFGAPRSLDEFEINIFDLRDEFIWRNDAENEGSVNCTNHFQSIKAMIKRRKNADIIFILPQNQRYLYYKSGGKYYKEKELKDMLENLGKYILRSIIDNDIPTLTYENTRTMIGEKKIEASFYFDVIKTEQCLTESIGGGKATTILMNRMYLTTLNLCTQDDINYFLKEVGLIKHRADTPEWMVDIRMFDDNRQFEVIQENNDIIKISQECIGSALKTIQKNNEYKSILYTTGDELVKVVFEILEEMLGCDLNLFVDNKKEDFLFELNGTVYIGEIKGVNHNVKSENISQIDVHYQGYLDEHQDVNLANVKAVLIMNHQKNKPIETREPIHVRQIKLAERNGSLIIETFTLLKLFEEYLKGVISQSECLKILTDNIGLLK